MTKQKGPKILALDIENSYLLAGTWGIWNQNIGLNQLLDHGKVMCFAAKWVGQKKVVFKKFDQEDFLDSIHALLDEADAVLTYNGRRHDIPMLNREFLKAGLTPPSPVKHIDLLETVKKHFKFPSNKMDHIADELGGERKAKHEGFPLWIKCIQGEKKAWATMKEYNVQDVRVLEELYDELLPWIANHPNHNLYGNTRVCTNCGGNHLHSRGYDRTRPTTVYQKFVCLDCGKWMRTRFTEVAKEDRHDVLAGIE